MYQDLQLDHPETDVNLEELKRTIGPLLFVRFTPGCIPLITKNM